MRKITTLFCSLAALFFAVQLQAQTSNGYSSLQEYLQAGNTIEINATQVSPSVITLVGQRGGSTTSFGDRTDFQNACGSTLPLEDFAGGPGGILGCGEVISSAGDGCFPPGELLDGFEVTSDEVTGTDDDTVYVGAGEFGNPDDIVGSNTFTEATVINYPGGDVTAAGMNLYALLGGANLEVTINGAGGVLDIYNVDVTSTGPVFFGVISPEPITSIVIEDLGDGNAELIGQMEFGSCGGGGIDCESTNYEATGLPLDIDGGNTSTADCANDPNLVSVNVTNLGVIGEDAEIENLEFTITHTFDGDLDISLVSPAGTELVLSAGNGGSGDNYVATVFEDGGADITAASAPFTGTFEPEGGTFADTFAGESVSGTWSLKVCDNFGGDSGQIVAFELNLCAQPFNDICDDAYAVECGDVITGDTSAATNTVGNDAPDVFFSYTGTGEEEVVTLSLCDGGTDYDSFLWVFDDCDLTTLIAANDDSCGLQSELSFYSDGTSTYIIVVEGFGNQSGNFSLDVSCGPVTNDICQGAESISCGDTVAGTTVGANSDFVDGCGTSVTAPGVWYTFTDDFGFETDYVVSTCDGTNYDSKLSVYVGDDCGNLVCVGGNDDTCGLQSEVAWTGDGSSTYYILVHGFGGASGDFNLNLSCTPIPPPNDEIANAIDVDEAGFPYTDPNVSLPAATTEDGNPEDCNIDGANGVWYKFTTTEAGQALAELDTPSGVSFVAFFEAPDEDSTEEELERVTQGGNQCLPSTTAFINTRANQTYYVFVVNTGGASDVDINYDVELGIQENGIEGFTFSPNPTRGQVTLSALDQIERATIYNILGQAVLDRSIEATSTQLDVSNLSTGTYIMKVTVNGQVGTYKLIKQ